MKSVLITISIILSFWRNGFAQFPVYVHEIESIVNQSITIKGDLNMGAPMDNLSWAWKGTTSCFESTQKSKFSGNHLLYFTTVPPHMNVEILIYPQNKSSNFSLYAYLVELDNYSTVPDLKSCIECEVDYMLEKEKYHDGKRKVSLKTEINSNNLIIGVSGANGLQKGEFFIQILMFDVK